MPDAKDFLAAACRQTDLEDFGDYDITEPLEILIDSYNRDAAFNLIGRITVGHHLVQLLTNLLRIRADRKRQPAIIEQQIRRPLFIIGLPRTGSTFLYELLAQDPGNRTPLTWEVLFPSPPPSRDQRDDRERIARADRLLRWFYRLAPEFKKIHPVGAMLPQECIAITSQVFRSIEFYTMHNVASYQSWLNKQDLTAAYRFHRHFLQHLQLNSRPTHWLMKAPGHLFGLDALIQMYPDAIIIHTHRDPLKAMASTASLCNTLRRKFSREVDQAHIGATGTLLWSDALNDALQVRSTDPWASDRFLDVQYPELVHNPIRVVDRIYSHYGLDLREDALDRMQNFIASHPKHKFGVHRYSLERFGLEYARERSRYAEYCDQFDIEPELVEA